jgi:hypothetical protein
MKTETKFRAGLAMSLLGLTIMTFEYFEKDRVYQELKISSSKKTDSLSDENFNLNVENGRHEFTREYFFGKHPKLQLEYENYLHHETE